MNHKLAGALLGPAPRRPPPPRSSFSILQQLLTAYQLPPRRGDRGGQQGTAARAPLAARNPRQPRPPITHAIPLPPTPAAPSPTTSTTARPAPAPAPSQVIDCTNPLHTRDDADTCPFVHPGEAVTRRPPHTHLPKLCPKARRACRKGRACPYAHNGEAGGGGVHQPTKGVGARSGGYTNWLRV